MLYNLVYNRDCMIHEIVCETGSGAPYDVTNKVMEDFFGEGCYDKAKAYTPINENKAKLAAYCVNDKNFHDSATLCNWMWPMTQSPPRSAMPTTAIWTCRQTFHDRRHRRDLYPGRSAGGQALASPKCCAP